jgi:hypothetical protein
VPPVASAYAIETVFCPVALMFPPRPPMMAPAPPVAFSVS